MLKVTVTHKFMDDKRNLIGYTIVDEVGRTFNVRKEALKQKIMSGEVFVTNMTLTRDGRLIGAAKKQYVDSDARANRGAYARMPQGGTAPVVTPQAAPAKPAPAKPAPAVAADTNTRLISEIYTNGKKIIAVLTDETVPYKAGLTEKHKLQKIAEGFTFDVGFEAEENIKKGYYANATTDDKGKVTFSTNVKKKQFKAVKGKLLEALKANNANIEISVERENKGKQFTITITNSDKNPVTINQIILCLLYNELIESKILYGKSIYIDDDVMHFEGLGNVNEVRKAVKSAFVNQLLSGGKKAPAKK